MPPQKFVDGDFLSRLLAGSHEAFVDAVEDAVQENAELFGGSDTVSIQTLGTFPTHALVLNSEGKCFRANLGENECCPMIESVVSEEMPVYGSEHVAVEARQAARAAVDAMLSEGVEAAAGPLAELARLVNTGVPITAWSYCRDIEEWLNHSQGWRQALEESSQAVGALLSSQSETLTFDFPLELKIDGFDGVFDKSLGRFYSELRESVASWQAYLAPLAQQSYPGTFGEFVVDLAEDVAALEEIQSSMLEFLEGPGASAHIGNLSELTEQLMKQLPVVSRGVEFATAFSRRFQDKEQVG
jgi:hypothetical protein